MPSAHRGDRRPKSLTTGIANVYHGPSISPAPPRRHGGLEGGGRTSIGETARSSGSAGRQDRSLGDRYGRSMTAPRDLGFGNAGLDVHWAAAVLGVERAMPRFDDPILAALARAHAGCDPGRPVALRGRRLVDRRPEHQRRRRGDDRAAALRALQRTASTSTAGEFWPPPRPEQLASAARRWSANRA